MKKNLLIIIAMITAFNLHAQVLEKSQNIGSPVIKGKSSFNPLDQSYFIKGSGKNMWFDKDEFMFRYTEVSGDFILRARVSFIGKGTDPHRKIGCMIRQSTNGNAGHASATVHGDGLTSLQFRTSEGVNTDEIRSANSSPDVIQIERRGDRVIMSTARFGEPFTTVSVETPAWLKTPGKILAGIFICSHNDTVVESALFHNVRLVKPAPETLTPYREFLGSHLEIMEVQTGYRKILHTIPGSLQAPNWTCDGKTLIYNQDGLLYNFDLATLKPEKINTGFATGNNNDHVLSFDCEMLGISDHTQHPDHHSQVYILPAKGGNPVLITEKAPSYLHGWSPDKKDLVFTGGRNGQYDIYKINIETKKEVQLTNTSTLDDGSEYTPDGKYIYFNSNRTGTMQVWRMKPDGSGQEQLTFDEFNNWFPHVSPDGKQVVMISYMPEVPSGDHPFYKHVYIRLMPVNGGHPRVIAYLYGGQGTMNVPNWSPDGRYISFVSNSGEK